MLTINVPDKELFNSENDTFYTIPGGIMHFENSLRAISKWEAKYETRFFSHQKDLTQEQLLDYFCFMEVDDKCNKALLTPSVINQLNEYIARKHSGTTLSERGNKKSRQTMSSELIYAYMVVLNIPFECDQWNINNLIKLISCVSTLNAPQKKRSSKDIAKDYSKMNAERRKMLNSKG